MITRHLRRSLRAATLLALGCLFALVLPSVASAEGACPNEQLRRESNLNPETHLPVSLQLPDCRAYEQVTPAFKDGASVHLEAVSPDDSHVIVGTQGNFGDAGNDQALGGFAVDYELTRTSTGWSEADLTPPASKFPFGYFLAASPDLDETLWSLRAASQSALAHDLYIRDVNGALHDLGPVAFPAATEGSPGLGETEAGAFHYRGSSSDFSHVLFELEWGIHEGEHTDLFWPGDATGAGYPSLYEHVGTGISEPKLVGVSNKGPLTSNTEAKMIGECGITAGAAREQNLHAPGGMSVDGSTVFFTVTGADDVSSNLPCPKSQPPVDELFARLDGSRTVAISEPSRNEPQEPNEKNEECTMVACTGAGPADAKFQGASSDGSKVFFISPQELTNSASEGSNNLYEYDFDNSPGHHLVLVSAGSVNPRVGHVVKISEDGSHVYFVAEGVLTASTPNSLGEYAQDGAKNLYVFERDVEFPNGRTSFIASADPETYEMAITSNGRFATFTSNKGSKGMLRYDAQTNELIQISVSPNCVESLVTEEGAITQGRSAISSDGSYVVFCSSTALTPQAKEGVRNIYEYHDGSIYLISDGHDATLSHGSSSVALEGVTSSGDDIFFKTADPLVPQDSDTQQDLYDARINGGFAAPVSGSCASEECQGQPAGAPGFAFPSSISLLGSGNVTPQSAAKPVVKPKRSKLKPLTRAQKLVKALTSCKKKAKRQRASCDAQARKKYGGRGKAKGKRSGKRSTRSLRVSRGTGR